MDWQTSVLALYLAVLTVLCLNGLHRLWLLAEYRRRSRVEHARGPQEWPRVTVQLPVYNERYVVQRLIEACGALDYPRERLQIQVLDDSTDDTTSLAEKAVRSLCEQGVAAVVLHRENRLGFKAGALAEGLSSATGELVAIFDADFVPPPNFLRRTVPHFTEGVGMVQARWGHLNPRTSWLTAAQSTLLDGHFVVEHTARYASGRWFNFNGTAGVWRREAITAGGGWQHDTLTEDLDLSYRAQLAGWRFIYLVDVVAPAELPPTMRAFKAQQHRWAKGSIQTARKLLVPIWRAPVPLAVKLEATAHLTANLSYPLLVVLSLILPWAILARAGEGPDALLLVDLALFAGALFPFLGYYGVAIIGSGQQGVGRRLATLPLALALGLGMALAQSRAVVQGLSGPIGIFERTPKTGGLGDATYQAVVPALTTLELAMALYLAVALVGVALMGDVVSLPFLGLFTLGYGLVALSSIEG